MPFKGFSQKELYKFFLLVALVLLFLTLGKFFGFEQEPFKAYLSRFPLSLSALIFIALYVGLTFFIWIGPKDILKIVALYLYGVYLSSVLIYIGEMLNVILLFSLSRRLGRDYVAGKLRGKMEDVDAAIADRSVAAVFFLRFFILVPFRFLNLGFGLTRISLKKYFLISALASPMRIFIIQLLLGFTLSFGTGLDLMQFSVRLSSYLTGHPWLLFALFVYAAGSLGLFLSLWAGRRAKASR